MKTRKQIIQTCLGSIVESDMSPNALTKNLILLLIAGLMLFAAWWSHPAAPPAAGVR